MSETNHLTTEELITFLRGEADIAALESCDGEPVTTYFLAAADRLAELATREWELGRKCIDRTVMLQRFIGMAQERTWPPFEVINEARELLGWHPLPEPLDQS